MSPPSASGEVLTVLAAQFAAFESLLLLAAALHKLLNWRHLETVVGRFAGLDPTLAPFALAGSAVLEVAAGGLLWAPGWRAQSAVLATVVWAAYLALIVRAIAAGRRDADCGCSFGAASRPLGAYQVTRNAVLFGLAALVAVDAWGTGGPSGGGPAVGAASAAGAAFSSGGEALGILAAGALLALYAALDQVMALQPLRGGQVS